MAALTRGGTRRKESRRGMNIVLAYPEFPDTFWSFKHALKVIQKRAALPPLGLMTVAAMLPPDWNVRLIDLNVRKLRDKDLAWADCVFVSAMTVQREAVRSLIARCKGARVKVVAGGPLFVAEHQDFPDVDHFVLNEAEITLPQFLADLRRGEPRRVYATAEYPDVRTTPAPRWELADLHRYNAMCIQFSRGCPFECEFCNVTALLGRRVRTKTAPQIITELDGLHRIGWKGPIFFVDDNFIGNKAYLKSDLLPALIEWRRGKHHVAFNTEASINLADDPELMAMMVDAGFDTVFIGIETPDEASLGECGKRQNRNRNLVEDVKRIQRSGLQVQGGFIVGFDNDTPGTFQRQIDFIQKSGIVTAMVGLLQAPPGTKLFDRLKREGRIRGQATGDNADGTTNISPRMGMETLAEGHRHVLRQLYAPKNYYQRIRTFLREYQPPRVRARIDFGRLMTFVRTTYRLGIFGSERFQYWRLLFWTWFRRPRAFPLAVTLAVYGHHFRKTCKQHLP